MVVVAGVPPGRSSALGPAGGRCERARRACCASREGGGCVCGEGGVGVEGGGWGFERMGAIYRVAGSSGRDAAVSLSCVFFLNPFPQLAFSLFVHVSSLAS